MDSNSSFNAQLANAGVLSAVAVAWALLFLLGSLDSMWLLAGFLTFGIGVLIIGAVRFISERLSVAFPSLGKSALDNPASDDSNPSPPPDVILPATSALPDEPEKPAKPRLRVVIMSAGLEALAVSLLAGYYFGSLAISLAVGVVACALAIGVSVLLSRKMVTAA